MTMRHSDSAAETRSKQLRFDRYVLDVDRGCLLLDGNEIRLRPKTFAVLSYLAANSGRLVSKDELFAAVWANVAVTDDTLVQSIGELRRALGDDGARLISTIPRRGYRFEAPVSVSRSKPRIARIAAVAAALLLLALALYALFAIDRKSDRAAVAVDGKPAFATLPLKTADVAHDYFAEGLTQDIIGAMGRFPELTVMSWNAVYP